jgi:hypothetical protein
MRVSNKERKAEDAFFRNKTMENLEKCSEEFFAEHFDETIEFEEDLEKMAPCSLKNIAAIQRRDMFGYMLEELGDKFSVEEMQIYEDGSVVELSRREPHVKEVTRQGERKKPKPDKGYWENSKGQGDIMMEPKDRW